MKKYTEFVQKLKRLLTITFEEVAKDKDLFEFGIFTDQDVTSIVIYYNTYTHFANQLKNWFLEDKSIVSCFRWSMPEWYGQVGRDHPLMDEVNNELYRIGAEDLRSPDSCYKDKDTALDLLHQALTELHSEGLFSTMDEYFILYLEIADSWIDERMRNRIKVLVRPNHYEEFLYDLRNSFN